MNHFQYLTPLQKLWKKTYKLYEQGNRSSSTYFNEEEIHFLSSIGMTPQELFDFVEDAIQYNIPDFFTTMVLIQDVRRSYFLEEQNGTPLPPSKKITVESLPPKTAEAKGILWLPRIIKKAQAKLQGAMPNDLMYCCGGDRKFFKKNNVNPAEFLKTVWMFENNDNAIIDWVTAKRKEIERFPANQGSLLDKIKAFFKN